MDEAVPSVGSKPLYVKASLTERLTAITVIQDSSAKRSFKVILGGTSQGRMLKMVQEYGRGQAKLIEALQVLASLTLIQIPYQFC